jgi:hypothetical protein
MPQSRTRSEGRLRVEPAELDEAGGQGRDRTADLAVFSRVRLVQLRAAWFGRVASALVSRGAGGSVVQDGAGPCGSVQISWAERRQNRVCAGVEKACPPVGAAALRIADLAEAR